MSTVSSLLLKGPIAARVGTLALALLCGACLPAAASAAPTRGFELVTPAGSVAAEPVAVHPYLGGDGFSYRSYDGQLGAPEGVWTAFSSERGAAGWKNTRWFGDQPLDYTYAGSNTRSPIATQPLGFSADGRTAWVMTMLPLVAEDENTAGGDPMLPGGSVDIYAITDGTPTLITRGSDGKAAGLGMQYDKDLADMPQTLPQALAVHGNKLAFMLARDKGQVIAESDLTHTHSLFVASANGTVERVAAYDNPVTQPLVQRPISDDGTRLLYLQSGHQMLWNNGTTVDLGAVIARSHLSADGKFVALMTKRGADAVNRIYRYEVATATFTLLSTAHDASAPTVDATLVDTSDDGTTAVFSTQDALTVDTSGPAVGATLNYYAHTPAGLRFIANSAQWSLSGDGIRVTNDGSVFFKTTAALVGTDIDASTDLYRWRAAGGLALLSTGPAGGNAAVSVDFGPHPDVAMGLGIDVWGMPAARSRLAELVSDDGTWAFFSSREKLTANAGANGLNKIYGSHNGELVLISPAGDDATEARYINNNATGRDVFFVTDQAIDPADTDGRYSDIYDARIGGGFATPPVAIDPCPLNACALPKLEPIAPAIATAATNGPGNQPPAVDPSNRFTLKRRSATRLRIGVPGEGRLTITARRKVGKKLRAVLSQTVSPRKASTRTVRLKLNRTGRSALARTKAKRLTLKVRVTFEPAGGPSRTRTITVRFTTKSSKR